MLAAVIAILLVSAGLRLYNLDSPPDYMFDEVYYAKDARALIDGRLEGKPGSSWEPGDLVSWPHPDAGKMAIALGILVAGDGPVGWRLPSVVAGLVLLSAVYPIARRLGLSREWAFVALLLASADLLGIAQSRIATLDIFVAAWTALSVLFALKYVQRAHAVRWLALSGLCGGLAVATKWSGALALSAALLIVLLGEQVRALAPARSEGERGGAQGAERPRGWPANERPADGVRTTSEPAGLEHAGGGDAALERPTHHWASRGRTLARLALWLVALPLAIYLGSYAVYFANGHTLADFRELHSQMWHFNFSLSAEHSYASTAPTWILDYRPVWYSFREIADRFHGVVAIGNPLLWWASILSLFAAPILGLRRRAATPVLAALLVVVLYLPWFATTRTSFLYYLAPVAPFLAVLVAAVAAELVDGDRRRVAYAVAVGHGAEVGGDAERGVEVGGDAVASTPGSARSRLATRTRVRRQDRSHGGAPRATPSRPRRRRRRGRIGRRAPLVPSGPGGRAPLLGVAGSRLRSARVGGGDRRRGPRRHGGPAGIGFTPPATLGRPASARRHRWDRRAVPPHRARHRHLAGGVLPPHVVPELDLRRPEADGRRACQARRPVRLALCLRFRRSRPP